MKPLSWLFLYLFFFSTIIIFNVINFFIFINKPLKNFNKLIKTKKNLLNWKW